MGLMTGMQLVVHESGVQFESHKFRVFACKQYSEPGDCCMTGDRRGTARDMATEKHVAF